MSNDIHANHPLFKQLRNGLLWHCTSSREFLQIQKDGCIKLNDGRVKKWGNKPYACQELGGVSLFDFSSQPEDKVLSSADRWQQFFACGKNENCPATVVIGLNPKQIANTLTPYPENKQGTRGNVIPWVEVCHCGNVQNSAFVMYLLVCPFDYYRFYSYRNLDKSTLENVEREFVGLIHKATEEQAMMIDQVRAKLKSPEFKALRAQARGIIDNIKR